MVSSVYPLTVSLNTAGTISSVAVVAGGTGYTEGETLTITGSTSGSSDATGTASLTGILIDTIAVLAGGTGYVNSEAISFTGVTSGATNATATVTVSGGVITAFTITAGGTGYTAGETLTVIGGTGSGGQGTANLTGAISTVTIVLAGTSYISGETVTLGGTGTSGTGTATTTTIAALSNILSSNLAVSSDQLRPTGAGILRLTFAFSFATTPSKIKVFNGGVFKGDLNADNSDNIITDGYYRFDIDVEAGDTINLQASQIVNVIRFLRIHLVLIGA